MNLIVEGVVESGDEFIYLAKLGIHPTDVVHVQAGPIPVR